LAGDNVIDWLLAGQTNAASELHRFQEPDGLPSSMEWIFECIIDYVFKEDICVIG
jgi:hypothetical protein